MPKSRADGARKPAGRSRGGDDDGRAGRVIVVMAIIALAAVLAFYLLDQANRSATITSLSPDPAAEVADNAASPAPAAPAKDR